MRDEQIGYLLERVRQSREILTPREVAEIFAVDPKTVTRWAKAGRIKCIKTLGGHRRYARAEVERHLINGADQ